MVITEKEACGRQKRQKSTHLCNASTSVKWKRGLVRTTETQFEHIAVNKSAAEIQYI